MQYTKYPRTYHLPYSLSKTDDDKTMESDEQFKNMGEVVVTIKMDGENTTIYPDGYIHSRSLDGNKYPWQVWIKTYIQNWFWKIPQGYRVCGENLYAKHSIGYNFKSEDEYFQCFGVYDENNTCLSWKETLGWCNTLNILPVHQIYLGHYDKDAIIKEFTVYCSEQKELGNEVEGFVVRNAGSFKYEDFSKNVGKYVRKNHVQTDSNWSKTWVSNKII